MHRDHGFHNLLCTSDGIITKAIDWGTADLRHEWAAQWVMSFRIYCTELGHALDALDPGRPAGWPSEARPAAGSELRVGR